MEANHAFGARDINRGTTRPGQRSPLGQAVESVGLPAIAVLFAIGIFIVDTFTPLGIAVAALYVAVVLLAGRFLQRRGIVLVASACITLTIASYLFQHGWAHGGAALVRCIVSLVAIVVTTFLALKSQAAALEREQAEAALRRSEANLADAQRLSKTGSFAWDVASGQIAWSDEAYRIFEYDSQSPPTLDFVLERTYPDDRGFVQRLLERVSRNRNDWEVEHRLMMPDGSVKHLHVVAHATGDEPDRFEYIGALMDVTDTKKAQDALQRAQAELVHVTRITTLGELTASIAHEVNQPLAAVVTNCEAALRWLRLDPPQIEEAQDALGRIIADGHRASEVIKRLRELAKKSDPEMAPLDINQVIRDVARLVQGEVQRHGVRLRLDLNDKIKSVMGDRVQLQQVLINLMMNGMEAMAASNASPRELTVRSSPQGNGCILVEVKDSGGGIGSDPDALFQAFYTTKQSGMGMGLAICRSIIETHDGELWVSPNDDKGATFHFTVPLHRDTET